MKRNILPALLALFMVISMTGCTSIIGLDTQALISPPKANADQQEIHQLLQGNSSELTFIYPKTGSYRSAIIMEDFTGDGQEDALGFTKVETGILVQFLVKGGEGWSLLDKFENSANQVDRVCFGDLNGDGQQDILIGWGSTQTVAATLGVYLYENGKMIEVPFEPTYDDMILTDFDEDGISEIFLTQKATTTVAQDETTETISASAQIYTLENGKITQISETEASNYVTIFTSIAFGAVNKDMLGVVVDGANSDGSSFSQVFYLDEERQLKSVPKSPNDEVKLFTRPSGGSAVTAMDINKDGIIELPGATMLPALPDALPDDVNTDSTSFLVEWSVLDQDNDLGYISLLSTYMNISEGYWFSADYPWFTNKITALNDTSNREVTYYEVENTENVAGEAVQEKGDAIFSIRVFNRTNWESGSETAEYEKIHEKNEQVYAILTLTKEKKYLLAIEKVKETFTLISD